LSAAGLGIGAALALALLARELASTLGRPSSDRASPVLTLAVRLLALAFTGIVVVRLIDYLR
jgi:hypothetical protein